MNSQAVPGPYRESRNEFREHHKPRLLNLLRSFGLDVIYHRAAGDFVYYYDRHGREVEVLDLVGGYGSLLLGHSHPTLQAEAQNLLTNERPTHVQGSVRGYARQLARELSRCAKGNYCVVFANSGAEAVETAIKHAMLETGSRTFVALEGAFHGKSLGALQLTANERCRKGFELTGLNVVRIRLNDVKDLEDTFARTDNLAGFIFEPVLGEGGVWPVEPSFARRAAELCAERNIPLIADECQTGVGRTGTFLACEALGVHPDYIILSKALGGGLAKIAAVLVRRQRYVTVFDFIHTSTYADDDYSCAIALKTLELVDEATLAGCREKGERLLCGLRRLKDEYAGVIADVRGRGLMIGVEFRRLTHSRSFVLQFLSSQDYLLYILMGYLFHVHRIRVAPTLSDPFTLRIQPSALIHNSQIDRFLLATGDICERLSRHDFLGLTQFLVDHGAADHVEPVSVPTECKFFAYNSNQFGRRESSTTSTRVAWLCHFIDADDLTAVEPDFGNLPFDEQQNYLKHFAPCANPVVMNAVDVRSRTGKTVKLYTILLPVTSHWIKCLINARKHRHVQTLVQRGVDIARSLDCGMVSLGQYTSIVTRNGRSLASTNIGLTTGNSYSIALAIQAIQRAQREQGRDPAELILLVAGAMGNIGRTCAEILAPCYRRVILLGCNTAKSVARLRKFSKRIPHAEISTDYSDVGRADVVLAATNSIDMPLGPNHFADNAIVCDVSVPPTVRPETALVRPDLTIIKGGIVRLPYGEDLQFAGFPLPPGQTYGCMAEGILLGFEGIRHAEFTGALTPDHVHRIEAIARRHGFEMADYKMSCVLGCEHREELHVEAR